ncbi:MAG: tRNA (cytidine(34)-2'-O)-methyltransferase [Pirellulales bacterium]|nr:tRNA (cytidine(34)-2'-O)-methyltransferase [Pirellulales bacterium]
MAYRPRLHIVLFEPEIPHNTGSVGRTCVAVGAKLWLVRPLGFQLDDYHLRRAGLDYWQHLEHEVVNSWEHLIEALPGGKKWLFSTHAQRSYDEATFCEGDALIFGNESSGLPRQWIRDAGSEALRIPIRNEVRSLNLSNSVAVACFEAQRQWNVTDTPEKRFP